MRGSSENATALTVAEDPEVEAQRAAEEEEMAQMLELKRPKHVVSGTVDGLKCITAGVVGGVVGLVAMPVIGAKQGGAKGFATGLMKGVAGAVVLPAAGAAAGATQFARGAIATPAAASGIYTGKQWDRETRTWRHYSLVEEAKQFEKADEEMNKLLEEKKKRNKQKKEAMGGVSDTTFYELLGVSSDASTSEIKRAYLKRARELHPDKNPDDPEAKERFQKLGEAYQVISNEDSRARYDARGLEGLQEMQFLDASTFYTLLFGSEEFEEYIGELQLASLMTLLSASEDNNDISMKQLHHKQVGREVHCALKLAKLLQPYVDGEAESFEAEARTKAENLSHTLFGELLLNTIGKVYQAKAAAALNTNPVGAASHYMKQKRHIWNTHLQAAKSVYKMYGASKDVQRQHDKEMEKLRAEKEEKLKAEKAEKLKTEEEEKLKTAEEGKQTKAVNEDELHTKAEAAERAEAKAQEGAASAPEAAPSASPDSSASAPEAAPSASPDSSNASAGPSNRRQSFFSSRFAKKDREGKGKEKEAAKPKSTEEATAEEEEEMHASMPPPKDMAIFMEGAWYMSVVDVENTLRHVCKKVLTDTSVEKEVRLKRARGLALLGGIFASAQSPETKEGGKKTLREQMEAFVGGMAPPPGVVDSESSGEDEASPPATADAIDEASLNLKSIKELKALCSARGIDTAGLAEKGDLVTALLASGAA